MSRTIHTLSQSIKSVSSRQSEVLKGRQSPSVATFPQCQGGLRKPGSHSGLGATLQTDRMTVTVGQRAAPRFLPLQSKPSAICTRKLSAGGGPGGGDLEFGSPASVKFFRPDFFGFLEEMVSERCHGDVRKQRQREASRRDGGGGCIGKGRGLRGG